MHSQAMGGARASTPLPSRRRQHRRPRRERRIQTMTSLRWDSVPKPRVERPPVLAPNSKSARHEQKPPNLKNRIEEAGGARIELEDLARPASAAARATSANTGSSRCSACKARGVTLWQVEGRLLCANCRTVGEMAYAPQSGRRGLTLSDTTTPRRKTVRRYDRVIPRKSELSPENAALLMKVNQQDTLVDMWR